MKRFFLAIIAFLFISASLFPINNYAQQLPEPWKENLIDRIVAVVGNEIILLSDVRRQINVTMMARKLDTNIPDRQFQSLFREVLIDMVNEKLLLKKAAEDSIEIDLKQLDLLEKKELTERMEVFGSKEEFLKALNESGLTEQQFRFMIRDMQQKMLLTQTLQNKILRGLTVSPPEMEKWVEANSDSLPEMPEQFRFSHILFYPQISEAKKAEIMNQMEDILKRIRQGEDFAELAKKYSQDPGSAPKGGDLEYFSKEMMVKEFSQAAFALKPGEVSEIVVTKLPTNDGIQTGFHIIKVEDIKDNQIRARHILMLGKPDASDDSIIVEKLNTIKKDILAGKATFEEMAKKYSEDENSNLLGGKLQWITREQAAEMKAPIFIQVAEKLKPGEISDPFKTNFGFHIMRLDGYKPPHKLNIKDDNDIVRQLVEQKKQIAEIDRIIEKLKQETYIEINLE
jgi:peptidyl-prolyl cis-trans isomerase SurA